MDPNATLAELRRIAGRAERGESEPDDLADMAELFDALDDWLCRGGFRPEVWQRASSVQHGPGSFPISD